LVTVTSLIVRCMGGLLVSNIANHDPGALF
jgi:hypothetical protein